MEHSKSLPQDAVKRSYIPWQGGKFKGEFSERTNEASCRLVVALPQMQIRSKTKKEQRLNTVKTNGLVGKGSGEGDTGVCQSNPCPTNPLLIKDCRPHNPQASWHSRKFPTFPVLRSPSTSLANRLIPKILHIKSLQTKISVWFASAYPQEINLWQSCAANLFV